MGWCLFPPEAHLQVDQSWQQPEALLHEIFVVMPTMDVALHKLSLKHYNYIVMGYIIVDVL